MLQETGTTQPGWNSPIGIESQLKKGIMPNLYSMSAKDALFLLENNGVNVTLRGFGGVKNKASVPVRNLTRATKLCTHAQLKNLKLLSDILYKVRLEEVIGSTHVAISSVSFDSRKVKDTLFVATRGTSVDGHKFIRDTVAAGAVAVLCEKCLPKNLRAWPM